MWSWLESEFSLYKIWYFSQLKSVDVVEAFISRIKDVNPVLNCVVDNCFDAALTEARAADKLIASGEKPEQQLENDTPFLGVPFTTKDAISVKGTLSNSMPWADGGFGSREEEGMLI